MEEGYADYRKYVNGLSFITNNLALALVSSLLELYQGTGSSLVHHFEQPFAPNQRIQLTIQMGVYLLLLALLLER